MAERIQTGTDVVDGVGIFCRRLPGPARPALGGAAAEAELLELPEAGRWPWRDDPSSIEPVLRFLQGDG